MRGKKRGYLMKIYTLLDSHTALSLFPSMQLVSLLSYYTVASHLSSFCLLNRRGKKKSARVSASRFWL